jgi:hypothetical protein
MGCKNRGGVETASDALPWHAEPEVFGRNAGANAANLHDANRVTRDCSQRHRAEHASARRNAPRASRENDGLEARSQGHPVSRRECVAYAPIIAWKFEE